MTAADAPGSLLAGTAEDVPCSSNASASELPTEPTTSDGLLASSSSSSSMPDVLRHLNPVAERVKGAAAAVTTTFHQRVVPSTSQSLNDAKEGWRTKVAPSLEIGGKTLASFFGKVTDKVRETNEKFRAENETFRDVGDGFSRRTRNTFETIKEGTRELRFGVADLMTRDPMTSTSAFEAANDLGVGESNASKMKRGENENASTLTTEGHLERRVDRAPSDPGALLGVRLETRQLWDAYSTPVPYAVLASCQWLSGSNAFFETPRAFRCRGFGKSSDDDDDDDAETSREEVASLLETLRDRPAYLIPFGTDPKSVVSALWRYLASLPEPLVSFSPYAALARPDGGSSGGDGGSKRAGASLTEKQKGDHVETLVGLLPPPRRFALECVLGLAAMVADRRDSGTQMDAEEAALAVAPNVAWPRAGRWSNETVRNVREWDASRVLNDAEEKRTRELRRVVDSVRGLVRRRMKAGGE
jgi:hypothetical protein